MKMDFQGGASVLASCGEACGVPKEHLKIARHFNAGSICKWHQVPEGRPASEQRFNRPSGTYPAANLFPALKRRAVFRRSLRDFVMFAFASILLAAIGATAQTTNALSDAEIQGRQLAQKLLDEQPTENFTNSGVFQIRSAQGVRSEVPVKCKVITTSTNSNWASIYEAGATNQKVSLLVIHAKDLPNEYFCRTNSVEAVPILTDIPYLGHLFRSHELTGAGLMFPFANSDFWLCDLGLEFLFWPGQKILRGDTARGRLCKILESTNPNPSTNGYSRVLSWIDNETLGIVEAEAYDAKGKLLKEFYPNDFKKMNGQWQVGSMEIRNVQTRSRTTLKFDLKKQ